MKKLLIGFLLLFAVSSTAYAGSMWGSYKGRPIVRVVVNGTEVQSAVPGQIIDGATMLPVRAISEAIGAKVEWNQQQSTATITTPTQAPQGLTLEIKTDELFNIAESVGLVHELSSSGQQVGTGSGFVTQGIFVTNWHVADEGVTALRVDFGAAQKTLQVSEAVFKNETADLIGFKMDGMQGLELDLSGQQPKTKVYVIGYPHHKFMITEGEYGLNSEVVGGIVHSAKQEPGVSGGALVNSGGKVIGVAVASFDNSPLSLAIPASTLQKELDKVK